MQIVDKYLCLTNKIEDRIKEFEKCIDFEHKRITKTIEEYEIEAQWAILQELLEEK